MEAFIIVTVAIKFFAKVAVAVATAATTIAIAIERNH
jgi:hypothetical protein